MIRIPSMSCILSSLSKIWAKNSSHILVGVGVGCMAAATVSAIPATAKAVKKVEEIKKEQQKEKLTKSELVSCTWKYYSHSVILALFGAGCVIFGHGKLTKANTALLNAYAISESKLARWEETTKEIVGEKETDKIRTEVCKKEAEEVLNNDISASNFFYGCEEYPCYDALSGQIFSLNYNKVRKVINDLQSEMNDCHSVDVREYYVGLINEGAKGLRIPEMDTCWCNERIDIYSDRSIMLEGRPMLLIQFMKPPTEDRYSGSMYA